MVVENSSGSGLNAREVVKAEREEAERKCDETER